ncbi:MAG: response regulator [Roseburia sp.]|nr:response regulator [Roseburia sp.]
MEKKRVSFYILLTVSTLAVICFATFFYIRQLNRTISDNIINSVSEIAEHDRQSIQSYIEHRWRDLDDIVRRFSIDRCSDSQEIQDRLCLETATSEFTHIYLLAEDGAVYTDGDEISAPGSDISDQVCSFLSAFPDGQIQMATQTDNGIGSDPDHTPSMLYGIRLHDCEIGGVTMSALIGITDLSSIQDKMVIGSFYKNGESRGHSALIDKNGNYIVNINKEVYLNERNNLYEHLRESEDSEMTNEELAQKLKNLETFGFYHSHKGEKYKELFYFMPFDERMDLYFILSVNEEVFVEQSRIFVTMSVIMLIVCTVTVIAMLLAVMSYKLKTVRASEKAKSQKEFLSNMSHEIRTPLNGLIGLNHLIMVHIDEDDQKDQIREWLRKSHSTANYLLSLVNDILDMSKLQSGKVDLISEPLLISDLMDEVAAMQTDNIKGHGVEFIVEKQLCAPCIEGDATHIKQILMNIVGNAAKFTPEGGSIRFCVRQEQTDERHVTTIFQCADTGIGISKEYLSDIFDAFSQERNRQTNRTKGTGLGMAISKLLANAMNGDITVESELHVGSTFTVTIPAVIPEEIPDYLTGEKTAAGEEPSPHAAKNDGPVKILVAEDVELNAEILLAILEMEGFQTVHAKNGKEAFELFERSAEGEFDIILMDMQMPVMDGCEATAAIRKLDRADASAVIIYACTANTLKEDRDRALACGMNDFLTKPIDIRVLLKKMNATTP